MADQVVLLLQTGPIRPGLVPAIRGVIESEVAKGLRVGITPAVVPCAGLDRAGANGAPITLAALDHASEQSRRAEDLDRQLARALELLVLVDTWISQPVVRHPQFNEARRELGRLLADARAAGREVSGG